MLISRHYAVVPCTLALALLPALGVSAQQKITVGTNSNGQANFYPFGVNFSPGYKAGSEYQELYSSASFAGINSPLTINDIAFASANYFQQDVATTATYDLTLRLSTTSATPATLDTHFAGNEGINSPVVFTGPLTVSLKANDTFDLVFPTSPFLYDPSQGNLLLDVVINKETQAGDAVTFLANDLGQTNRVYQYGGNGPASIDNEGLYTQFSVTPAAVPEASTTISFGLLLTLSGIAVLMRKKAVKRGGNE